MVTAESPASRVGHITLDRKQTGKPIAGNRHDGFEVAGAGNQLTVWLVRHSQRKRGATDRLNLRSTAPVLDPTTVLRASPREKTLDYTKRESTAYSGLLYSDGINCTSDAGRSIYGLLVAYPEAGLPLLE